MRPPVAGMHGRHRVFATPGPTGWNDHGDPSHERQAGPTPGSLGVNDHGTPLPPPSALLLPERRHDIEAHINQIIEEANAAVHPETTHTLQACHDAAKSHGGVGRSQDEVGGCAEAYFYARLHALHGKGTLTGGHEQNAWRNALPTGGVEYRTTGTFSQSPPSSKVSLGLTHERIGQALPGRDAGLATGDNNADWIERGVQDGLRDRSDASDKLRRHTSIK